MGRLKPAWNDFVSSWGPLGSVLRASWTVFGALWRRLGGVLGRVGAFLGASWGVLERLGGLLGRLWADFIRMEHFFGPCHLGSHFQLGCSWILLPKIKA